MADKEKTEKSAPKTPKVFDVSKPSKSAATATSRPVIVTNRPIIQDPMVAPSATLDESQGSSSATVKVNIKPLSAPEPESETIKDDTKESPAASEVKVALDDQTDVPVHNTELKPVEKVLEAPKADTSKAPETSEVAKDTESSSDNQANSETNETISETPEIEQTKDEKMTAELEAAAKQEEEVAKLVESQEHFLPINAVEKRRSKVTGIVGFLTIVILALLLLNFMLDAGTLTIPGIEPLTNLFGA